MQDTATRRSPGIPATLIFQESAIRLPVDPKQGTAPKNPTTDGRSLSSFLSCAGGRTGGHATPLDSEWTWASYYQCNLTGLTGVPEQLQGMDLSSPFGRCGDSLCSSPMELWAADTARNTDRTDIGGRHPAKQGVKTYFSFSFFLCVRVRKCVCLPHPPYIA